MAQFASSTEQRGSGIGPREWNNANLLNKTFGGNKMVTITKANGERTKVHIGTATLLFKDPVVVLGEHKGSVSSNAPCVIGTPVGYVDSYEANMAIDELIVHKLIPYKTVDPVTKDEKYHKYLLAPAFINTKESVHVLKQYGAQWVGAGDPYAVKENDQFSSLMYLYAIQSVLWQLANEKDNNTALEYIEMAVNLCQSAKAYFDENKNAFKIVEALQSCDNAIDMLNRTVSLIFKKDQVTTEDIVRIVEISLKRWGKKTQDKDFVTNPVVGIMAILVYYPAFQRLLFEQDKDEKTMMSNVNKNILDIVSLIASNLGERGAVLNKKVMFRMFEMSGVKISLAQSDQLYDYCLNLKNFGTLAPLDDWKITQKLVLPINLKLSGFKASNKNISSITKVNLFPGAIEGGCIFSLSSSKADDWSGVGLNTPGEYKFQPPKIIGAGEIGIGSTQGKRNQAMFRVTYGHAGNTDVMPKGIPGKSTAGMLYSKEYEKFDYRQKDPLDITKPFSMTINDNMSFSIKDNNNELWFEGKNEDYKDACVLFGYKFLEFNIEYRPPIVEKVKEEKVEASAEVEGEPGAPEQLNPLEGLTGIALVKKLQELSLAEKNKKS